MHFKYALTTLAVVSHVLAGKRIYPKPRIAGRLYGRQNDQESLTLAADLVQPASAKTGQEDKVNGQVESLTSNNNFINFCAQFPNVPLTNGEQIFEGSCNGIPSGLIPAKNKMPSTKVLFPKDGDEIEEFTDINFQLKTRGMQTGSFTNAQLTYYAAPTQLNGNGEIIGHNHITVDEIQGDDTEPTNPEVFAFFKGVNDPAVNGVLSATAVGGLKAGRYRVCSMAADSNHRPIIPAVAQRAQIDDCKRFTVVPKGTAGNNGGNAGNNGGNAGGANGGNAGNGAANAGNANNGAANGGNANNGAANGGNANNGAANGGNNGAANGGNANNGAANGGNANNGGAAAGGNANANNGQQQGQGRNRNGGNRGGQQRNGGNRNQRQGQKRTNMPQQEMGRRSFSAGGRSRIARV